jgi:hypothetical protein
MTRLLFATLLLALTVPRWSHAEELISGVLAFDPPAFLSDIPSLHDSTNSENGIHLVRRYAAADNDPRTSQRLVIVSLREVGSVPASGKVLPSGQLDSQALRDALLAAANSTRNAAHITSVTNAEVGGQSAWLVAYQIPRPYWQNPAGELFPYEVYWVQVQTNQVAEIKLIADSAEHLQSLKTCLPRFKIIKPDASTATVTTSVKP